MRVREAVDDYLYAIGKTITTKTRINYVQRLGAFVRWCDKEGVDMEGLSVRKVGMFLDQLEVQASTARAYGIVIKSFLNWCSVDAEYGIGEKWVKRIGVPQADTQDVTIYTDDELRRLFRAVDSTENPVRNRAILYLLLDTGARVSELFYDNVRPSEKTGLSMNKLFLDARDRKGEPDPYIVLMGKGRKERQVGLGAKSLSALRKYIRQRPRNDSDLVFLGRGERPLSVRGAQAALDNIADIAGVKDVHMHKFRHTFAVNYLLNGGSDFMLMRLLGHTSLNATQIYLRAMSQSQARKGGSVLDNLL